MFEIAFLKAESELDNAIFWQFIPFCNCPWVEGILLKGFKVWVKDVF